MTPELTPTGTPCFQQMKPARARELTLAALDRESWSGSWKVPVLADKRLGMGFPPVREIIREGDARRAAEALAILTDLAHRAPADDLHGFRIDRYRIAYRALLTVADPDLAHVHLHRLHGQISALLGSRGRRARYLLTA